MTPFIPYGEPSVKLDYRKYRDWPTKKDADNWFNVDDKPKRRGAKVMDEAAEIINGDRNEHYGEPEDNFRNIAEMWNAYLRPRYGFDKLDAYDVAMLMVLMKVARNGHHRKLDNLVDLVGYAAHAGDIDALQK